MGKLEKLQRNFSGIIDLKNTTLYWHSTDSEEHFLQNMKKTKTREILEEKNWADTTIEYKFNNFGFRCDDFDETDCIVTLGCSYTFGTGLPIEDTFAQNVADNYKLKNYNLAVPGAANSTCFRLAYKWLSILKPKYVVVAHPHRTRLALQKQNGVEIHLKASHIHDREAAPYRAWYKTFVLNDNNVLLDYEKNTMAIKYLCQTNNIPLINFEIEDYLPDEKTKDYARDLLHYGVKTQKRISNMVINQIDNLDQR